MKRTRKNQLLLALAGLATLGLSFSAVSLLLSGHSNGPHATVDERPLSEIPTIAEEPVAAPLSLDQGLLRSLNNDGTEVGRLTLLEDFSRHPEARSDSAALRTAMLTDRSAAVRLKAFNVAKELATREDRRALIAVLKEGVGNPHADVRRAGIRACRDNPHFELMKELLEVVERGGAERQLAIQALAFLDDPEAHLKVLDTARSTTVPREQRIQAIALLSRTRLEEAVAYLRDLATGEDDELSKYAMEALTIWQRRKAER